ncbi:MAG: heme biosynthesis protein HemY, partial [Rhodospirillaceae bacterium]|nr:heme biosynthesis protein HemY [Rhodospirillaceae bacterium]
KRRSRKGYKALTQGMVAVAAGDAREAAKQVKRADGLLGDPPLTLLLKAQSAQLNGDEGAAETFFKSMLEDQDTQFLGLRGLLGQAMKAGDREAALELARRAHELKPKSEWLADILFELEGSSGHWALASQSLKRLDKIGNKPGAAATSAATHRRAVVSFGRSLEAESAGDRRGAIKWAEKALGQDPGFIPAAIRLANIYADENRPRKTARVVESAWALTPNPQLLEPYFRAQGAVDGLKKVKAAERLARANPGHPESLLALAQAALEARLWGQARTHLDGAMENGAGTRRIYAMQAALDEEEKQDSKSAGHWLRLAASAPADPEWVCGGCGHVDGNWRPYCPSCAAFDSARWRSPPHTAIKAVAEYAVVDHTAVGD